MRFLEAAVLCVIDYEDLMDQSERSGAQAR